MRISLIASLLMVTAATSQLGAVSLGFDLYFDEDGNATYVDHDGAPSQNGYGLTTSTCPDNAPAHCGTATYTLSNGAIGGIAGNILVYALPELVLNGPVAIYEANNIDISDVLWFTNAADIAAGNLYDRSDFGTQNANLMIYFSADVGGGFLADSGLPTNINLASLVDEAQEDANGNFVWSPAPNNYYGASPETPEPASLSMLLLGAGAMGFGAWRRKKRS